MIPNSSPWLAQLNRTRPAIPLSENRTTDIVIVGGGIAGAISAYFTLRDTQEQVIVIEADRVAHGATGHNAGQITSYFERPFESLVKEFGLRYTALRDMLVALSSRSLLSTWKRTRTERQQGSLLRLS